VSEKTENSDFGEKMASSWTSPSGLDLNPRPRETVRISRRLSMALVGLAVILLAAFAYGGWKRRQRQVAAMADANMPKSVAPATAAAADIVKDLPGGSMSTPYSGLANPLTSGQLQAPQDLKGFKQSPNAYGSQSVTVQPGYVAPQAQEVRQLNPEEQRLQAAYESEQRAITAPTGLRDGFGGSTAGATAADHADSSAQFASALQSLAASHSENGAAIRRSTAADVSTDSVASIDKKESFVANARAARNDDDLKSMRTAPLTDYEIKAGWEIPAVMEQGVDSDLPGELKALVTANVYDTASGRYMLIPQGARLVGEYNSQLGYGQDGVQVVWNRVIYPDGSSLDLSGMIGQDAQGLAGFRDKIDHHYKRLISFAVLSSLFSAASQVSQNQNRSVLTYPSPGQVAGSAVGQQASDLGVQITRKNLNVQPTVKISVGYRFNVRVNRDIVFEAPYTPLS
jgi:type IV secretion system protein TrbI